MNIIGRFIINNIYKKHQELLKKMDDLYISNFSSSSGIESYKYFIVSNGNGYVSDKTIAKQIALTWKRYKELANQFDIKIENDSGRGGNVYFNRKEECEAFISTLKEEVMHEYCI